MITQVHFQTGMKLQLDVNIPNNMTASKYHKIIKKLGGKMEGRSAIFDNQNQSVLAQKLIENGIN